MYTIIVPQNLHGCNSCESKESAVALCKECGKFLCSECGVDHLAMQRFVNHTVIITVIILYLQPLFYCTTVMLTDVV